MSTAQEGAGKTRTTPPELGEPLRYLVRVKDITETKATVRFLHRMHNNVMDLQPLDADASLRINKNDYDSILAMRLDGSPAVVEIQNGTILSIIPAAAEPIKSLQRVVFQPVDAPNTYGIIHVAKEYSATLVSGLIGMNYEWSHVVNGEKHNIGIKDTIVVDGTHCPYCTQVCLQKSGVCIQCKRTQGIPPVWNTQYTMIGMIKLWLSNITLGGTFLVTPIGDGRYVITSTTSTVTTSALELEKLMDQTLRLRSK